MRVVLTGGGTGGHFYPLIAVAREIRHLSEQQRFVSLDMYFLSNTPIDQNLLVQEDIQFIHIPAGKVRRYFSWQNLSDVFLTLRGIIKACFFIFTKIPDVVFSKGGYTSFPALVAARLLAIPVIIHESDSVPGRVNSWSAKFAKTIALSFPDSQQFFPNKNVIISGNPIRKEVISGTIEEARDLFNITEDSPVIMIIGGSQGAAFLNDVILSILPNLIEKFQVIHQTGPNNFSEVTGRVDIILEGNSNKQRYHPISFLDAARMRSGSAISSLIISRGGGGSIFEIAAWGKPAILVPLENSAQDHQRSNSYQYAQRGAAVIIEQENLTPHLLLDQIQTIIDDEEKQKRMSEAARSFARLDAAAVVAQEVIRLGLHEKNGRK